MQRPAPYVHSDRPYQKDAIGFLLENSGRGAVRAPTGAGKTYIALKTVSALEPGFQRLLIVVPRFSALLTWKNELEKMQLLSANASTSTELVVVEKWTQLKRAALWNAPPVAPHRQIVLVLYNTLARDIGLVEHKRAGFDTVIFDESHRIRNRKTKNFKAAKRLSLSRERRVMFLTATPQSRGVQDLWTTLHCLRPSAWPSYWKFVGRYCVIEDDGFGQKPIGAKKATLPELRHRVSRYVHNISKREIRGWVPESVRFPLYVKLDRKVGRIYRQLAEEMLAALPDGTLMTSPSVLASTIRLRQLLACPALIHESLGAGVGVEAVLDHALDNDPHFVLFSEFTQPFPVWSAYMRARGVPEANIFTLQGGMSLQQTETTIRAFEVMRKSELPSVLMCSIAFSESFDLLTPENGYFLGFSWDQNLNYQAEGRLTRGAKDHCNFFYVIHDRTVDTSMLSVLDQKVRRTEGVVFESDRSKAKAAITKLVGLRAKS